MFFNLTNLRTRLQLLWLQASCSFSLSFRITTPHELKLCKWLNIKQHMYNYIVYWWGREKNCEIKSLDAKKIWRNSVVFFFKLAKKKGPNLAKIGINRNFPYSNFLKSQNEKWESYLSIISITRRVGKTTVFALSYLTFHCLNSSLCKREKGYKHCKEMVKLFFANGIIL